MMEEWKNGIVDRVFSSPSIPPLPSTNPSFQSSSLPVFPCVDSLASSIFANDALPIAPSWRIWGRG
jgi:hypothetical protein